MRYLRALLYSVFPNVFYINWHLCWKQNCLKSQIWVLIFLSLSTTNSGLTEVRNPDFSVIRSHSNWKIINLSKKSLIKKPLKKAKLMLYCTKENKYQANCWESAAFRVAPLNISLVLISCASPSDNLIPLSYSMPPFSANLFRLFFHNFFF